MKGQRNDFMQGKTQDPSWGEGIGYDDLEARHTKIHPMNIIKSFLQLNINNKYKIIEISCQMNEVNIMSLSTKALDQRTLLWENCSISIPCV